MTNQQEYAPPHSSTMLARQNEPRALRLLIAQRRIYRRAKRWLGLKWIGMVLIGVGAPVAAVLWPGMAVVAGAIAGAWIFAGRTLLTIALSRLASQAACVQEQFDQYVFQMPATTERSMAPSAERLAYYAGASDQIQTIASKERLKDWYEIDSANDGVVSVALAQRANASYADGLLRSTATAWSVATALWCVVLIIGSVWAGLTLQTFLLGVLLPVLPAFLDVVEYVLGVWRSATGREDLARSIEQTLLGGSTPEPQELLVWQGQLFDLRRTTPDVPDIIYKLKWKSNERAMRAASSQLSQQIRGED